MEIINGYWLHVRNNTIYEVIGMVDIKVAIEGRWVEGVLYKDIKTNKQYVRSKENFLDRFTKEINYVPNE